MNTEKIFKKNSKWIAKKLAKNHTYFTDLAKDQEPDFIYFGCSDSRVPAETIMGIQPGEAFVHRNIANLVAINDPSAMSVITYGINYLNIKNIVVCGHTNCGGVKAAMDGLKDPVLNYWIKPIKEVELKHKEELDLIISEDKKYNRLIELNILEQCENIQSLEVYQNAIKTNDIKIHAWIFDINTGKLIDLKF